MNYLKRNRPSGSRGLEARMSVFQVSREDSNVGRQLINYEEFGGLINSMGGTMALATPYDTPRLFEIINQSNMIQQCIDAYLTNTVQTGWEVGESSRGLKFDEGEAMELQSFADNANTEESLAKVMSKIIWDREAVGYGFKEVIRDMVGRVSLLRHCPSLNTRLCTLHPEYVQVTTEIKRGRRTATVVEMRRFRRYVQIVNGKQVWFREFGDPRRMDYTNGAFEGEPGFNPANNSTELKHYRLHSNDAYGIPRWIAHLPSILGSREAEEFNMRYFQDNTVPPMFLTVGGGRLTQASYRELSRALSMSGTSKQNRIMLLEAVGEGDSLDGKSSAVDLKVEKLADQRPSDGLFKEYDQANMAKLRSAWRLPPITVGMSQDVNFATASTSAFVAESQVFAPAREEIDETLNKTLVNNPRGLNLRTVKLVSRTPAITSPEMVLKTLTALNVMGAVTPRAAQRIANTVLQSELDEYPEQGETGYEDWMDKPIIFASIDAAAESQKLAAEMQAKTHEEQAIKDQKTKETEEDGDISADVPKHGEE